MSLWHLRIKAERLEYVSISCAGTKICKRERLSDYDKEWLRNLSQDRVSTEELSMDALFQELLMRVDTVPPELALAQAAIESAWGQSRFAYCGNNLFGEYCFTPGCGIVPAGRPQRQTYEVAAFLTPIHAVHIRTSEISMPIPPIVNSAYCATKNGWPESDLMGIRWPWGYRNTPKPAWPMSPKFAP